MAKGKTLLLDEYPLIVLPSLAVKLGLNEAIFLQQVHYWIVKDGAHEREGRKWVYNTYEQWQEQMPWWSVSTIRRIVKKLNESEILVLGVFNKMKADRTLWYSIDYSKLDIPSGQFEHMVSPERTDGTVQNGRSNTIDYTETTTEKTTTRSARKPNPYFDAVVSVCGYTPAFVKKNGGAIGKTAAYLREESIDPAAWEQEFTTFWREHDWRGKKGQMPKHYQIPEVHVEMVALKAKAGPQRSPDEDARLAAFFAEQNQGG